MGYTKDLQIKHQFFCDMIGNQTSSYIIVYSCTSGVYLAMLALGKPKKNAAFGKDHVCDKSASQTTNLYNIMVA